MQFIQPNVEAVIELLDDDGAIVKSNNNMQLN